MSIYVQHNGNQLGPFTEAEIKAQLASGAISPQDHVWWEGQQDWVVLSQTPYGGSSTPGASVIPGAPPAPYSVGGAPVTSKLAIWALVCGCLSLLCGIFASIPAIILGHMGRSEIKKNPAIQGGGMALAGLILGYFFTTLIVIYLVFVIVLVSMGMNSNVKNIFKTINAQIAAAQAAQATNSADQNATPPDQTTNAPDQATPVPASPDQATNSPASSPAASMPGTNAPDSTTNAAPMNQ